MTTLQRAGESVERRGFLDANQVQAFYNKSLMEQVGHLMEEVGEFAGSLRDEDGPSIDELADVAIVCGAIARVMGWDLDAAVLAKCAADEERGYRHSGQELQPVYVPAERGENGSMYRDVN